VLEEQEFKKDTADHIGKMTSRDNQDLIATVMCCNVLSNVYKHVCILNGRALTEKQDLDITEVRKVLMAWNQHQYKNSTYRNEYS
jgi:hypothetical protein